MQRRRLGTSGPVAGAIGFGAMPLPPRRAVPSRAVKADRYPPGDIERVGL